MKSRIPALLVCTFLCHSLQATQEREPEPFVPAEQSRPNTAEDVMPATAAKSAAEEPASGKAEAAGPITSAGAQPLGALTGRVIYMSGGHGWQAGSSSWALDRPSLLEMNEDMGNVDQMTLFAYYCFNAGATVVPFRPVGNQTNEVVLDNDSPGVTWSGTWANSGSTVYFGSASDAVRYRFVDVAQEETATATYTPNIPVSDFYPVYCWALGGDNRVNQLYKINHSGGQSLVRVPHNLVGGGWVYLGTYYFNAGFSSQSGAVIISNLAASTNDTGVVVADAIRFGNGMGDVDVGGGVSTYPREDEGNRYWIQRSLGQGQPTSIYTGGNVSAPIRMAAEMNNQTSGNMYKRAYVGFHSNATTGNPATATSRGVIALWNNTADPDVAANSDTPNQYNYALKLATEVNSDMVGLNSLLEVPWQSRASLTYSHSDFAYGEINNNIINDEFDATIVEVAFHDNVNDALLLRDPKARNWIARSVCQGLVRYFNQYDGQALIFLPEPPHNVRAVADTNGVRVTWEFPASQAGSSLPIRYVVYRSTDGYGFGQPVTVTGATSTSVLITDLNPGTDYYFRVAAVNAGGESMPSETVGCRIPETPQPGRILVVNGFTRFDRTLAPRQTLTPEGYKAPGHDRNTGAITRVLPRKINSFDYVVAHGKAIAAVSELGFDSCQLRAVTNGTISLNDYTIVIWNAGNQSTKDRTFNTGAQNRIATFLANGGNLFVSGSDVAFDLGRASGPSLADRSFLTNQLHAALANDNSGIYSFTPTAGSIFAGNTPGIIDDGSKHIYWVPTPDALTPSDAGTTVVLSYPGFAGGAAAVRHAGSAGGGKVILMGFPFETITSAALRAEYMADVLRDFVQPVFTSIRVVEGTVQLGTAAQPGTRYLLQSSSDLVTWKPEIVLTNTTGELGFDSEVGTNQSRFYRIQKLD